MIKSGQTPTVEWGGLIYSKADASGRTRHYATRARTDNHFSQVDVDCIETGTCKPSCDGLPAGATSAGSYHTHPTNNTEFGFGAFSDPFGDIDLVEKYNRPSPIYVMHKSGDVFEYKKGGTNPTIPFTNVLKK